MQRWPIRIGMLLLTLSLGGLSLVYLREARAARRERQQALDAFQRMSGDYVQKLELRSGELRSALVASERRENEMLGVLARLTGGLGKSSEAADEAGNETPDDTTEESIAAPAQPPPPLPEIPEGVEPQAFLSTAMDLKSLASDLRFNPEARQLSRVDRLELMAEVKKSQAKVDVLDAEVKLAVAKGIEVLRERGDYVQYKKGERYETTPGTLSAGEETEDGGVRMFYLHPDEFQDVYTRKIEHAKALEHSVRRILARVRGSDPGAAE